MAVDKLLAEWFWTDRWMGSSAFLLPMEARGLYREMLTQAWRRGASLPNDHEAIRRAVGATPPEWKRSWPSIERFWRVSGELLVNDTQCEIYRETQARQAVTTTRAKSGAKARWSKSPSNAQADARADARADAQASRQAKPEQCAPDPDPYKTPISPLLLRRAVLEPAEFVHWFDKIYAIYPNKDRKVEANRAWVELNPDLAAAQAILSDVTNRVKAGWKRFERRFIPQLRKYLDERMWEDAKQEPDAVFDEDPYKDFSTAWTCSKCGDIHQGTTAQRGQCLAVAS